MLRYLSIKLSVYATFNATTLRLLHHSNSATAAAAAAGGDSAITLSYLTGACGLSHSAALSVLQRINRDPKCERTVARRDPDSVLAFFESQGFSKPQTAKLVSKWPQFLFCSPDRTLKPKMDFYLAAGFSPGDLAKLIVASPALLRASLENRIIPSFNFLKAVVGTDEDARSAIKRSSWVLRFDAEQRISPNLETLRKVGVPESNISRIVRIASIALIQKPDRFVGTLKLLEKMGFCPSSKMFAYGLQALSNISEENWLGKLSFYRSFGLSEDEIFSSIRYMPLMVNLSDKNFKQSMNFFRKKLQWEPGKVLACPLLLALSLEKRIAPRVAVCDVLAGKGLMDKNGIGPGLFLISEKKFMEKYVVKFQDKLPQLLDAYNGKSKEREHGDEKAESQCM